jgi:hypothetical protein
LFKEGRWLTAVRQTMIIVTITIIMCEMGVRIFNEAYPQPFFYSNSCNRFRVKPHSAYYGFELNSRGFHVADSAVPSRSALCRMRLTISP